MRTLDLVPSTADLTRVITDLVEQWGHRGYAGRATRAEELSADSRVGLGADGAVSLGTVSQCRS